MNTETINRLRANHHKALESLATNGVPGLTLWRRLNRLEREVHDATTATAEIPISELVEYEKLRIRAEEAEAQGDELRAERDRLLAECVALRVVAMAAQGVVDDDADNDTPASAAMEQLRDALAAIKRTP